MKRIIISILTLTLLLSGCDAATREYFDSEKTTFKVKQSYSSTDEIIEEIKTNSELLQNEFEEKTSSYIESELSDYETYSRNPDDLVNFVNEMKSIYVDFMNYIEDIGVTYCKLIVSTVDDWKFDNWGYDLHDYELNARVELQSVMLCVRSCINDIKNEFLFSCLNNGYDKQLISYEEENELYDSMYEFFDNLNDECYDLYNEYHDIVLDRYDKIYDAFCDDIKDVDEILKEEEIIPLPEEEKDFYGTWKLSSVIDEETRYTVEELEMLGDNSLSGYYLIFKEGGIVFFHTESEGDDTGNWSYDQSKNTLTIGKGDWTWDGTELKAKKSNSYYICLTKYSDSQNAADLLNDEKAGNSGSDIYGVGIRDEVKDAIDAFEEFVNEFCEFMEIYLKTDNPGADMLEEYARLLEDFDKTNEELEEMKDDLNDAELEYYKDSMTRCSKRLSDLDNQ